uniref:Uncharacterized protein n=1 Tax=Heterorhabditis bacteriophora TaxID=37862 RepID=A0A1I7WNS2_HETBA
MLNGIKRIKTGQEEEKKKKKGKKGENKGNENTDEGLAKNRSNGGERAKNETEGDSIEVCYKGFLNIYLEFKEDLKILSLHLFYV